MFFCANELLNSVRERACILCVKTTELFIYYVNLMGKIKIIFIINSAWILLLSIYCQKEIKYKNKTKS